MSLLQRPRGTQDILPDEMPYWQTVKAAAEATAIQFAYQPITIPTFEYASLFQRTIGEGTDVMDKELFMVRSHAENTEQYALRPEGTAGIVRAFLENGLHLKPLPVKLYSLVNVFRYDRPQKGRYREHTQLDLESFGETDAFSDAWLIAATYDFYNKLGLKHLTAQVNSLGTNEERQKFTQAFKTYLQESSSHLSEDSQRRLELNPLRILDSKDKGDQEIVSNAPKLFDFLSPENQARFEEVQMHLTKFNIPFKVNHLLVRGLDYYSHTVFEWVSSHPESHGNSLGGGGRYDDLLPKLGGPNLGAIGVGIGLERVILEMQIQNIQPTITKPRGIALISDTKQGQELLQSKLSDLLATGHTLLPAFHKEGISSQIKWASKRADFAIIVGESELEQQNFSLKNFSNGQQESLDLASLIKSIF